VVNNFPLFTTSHTWCTFCITTWLMLLILTGSCMTCPRSQLLITVCTMGVWFQLGTRCQKTLLMATSVWNSLGSAGKWTEYQIVKGGTTTLKKTCQDNRTNTRKGGLQICIAHPTLFTDTLILCCLWLLSAPPCLYMQSSISPPVPPTPFVAAV